MRDFLLMMQKMKTKDSHHRTKWYVYIWPVDLDMDGRITLKWTLRKQCEDVDILYTAQDRVLWQDLMNTVTNIQLS
jgi:hypothetical protein